jgi:hypothetical protein
MSHVQISAILIKGFHAFPRFFQANSGTTDELHQGRSLSCPLKFIIQQSPMVQRCVIQTSEQEMIEVSHCTHFTVIY